MAKLIDELSVFLPVYNEESNLQRVVLKTKEARGDKFTTRGLIGKFNGTFRFWGGIGRCFWKILKIFQKF